MEMLARFVAVVYFFSAKIQHKKTAFAGVTRESRLIGRNARKATSPTSRFRERRLAGETLAPHDAFCLDLDSALMGLGDLRLVGMATERGVGQEELEAVELVNLAGARVVVDGGDVRLGEAAAQFLDHALAGDVVR